MSFGTISDASAGIYEVPPPGRLFYNYRDTTRAPLKRRSPAETLLSPPASIMRCCPVGSGGGCQTSKGCADVHVSLLPVRSKSE